MRSLILLTLVGLGAALGSEPNIRFEKKSDGDVLLADGLFSPSILLDKEDSFSVLRAADDLAVDFGRVTGVNGSTILADYRSAQSFSGTIIAGTLNGSRIIQYLVDTEKIDMSEIEGEWEAYTTKVVKSPLPGIDSALIIAGSDRRGTIYGLYDVSEQIGVSPYYFWADVPPKKRERIFAADKTKIQPSPSVKYRGIFINDEAPGLTSYVNAKFGETERGSPYAHEFYETVFELLLRLRANYLWPAMWASMFNVDDPLNPVTAERYGIVMGTSHTEPLARATNEWESFGDGEWAWDTNNQSIYPFFVDGAERALHFENVMTMAMRGVHDTAIGPDPQIDLLEDIVAAQREILKHVYDRNVPQAWCLYKEVQAYSEQGMDIPDDIILLWADDNFGNMRRLPVPDEYERVGGAGVYYHFDYVGHPVNYKWLNQVQLRRTWQQMTLAYQRHARDMWVVNVGDIKPMEIPLNHFLDMAYDITEFEEENTIRWLEKWAHREFGPERAKEIAEISDTYTFLANRRKYEILHESTYSIINYDEAESVLRDWTKLRDDARAIYDELPEEARPAYFEFVLYQIEAGHTIHDLYISTAKNRLYGSQGRTSTNALAHKVLEIFDYDRNLTEEYHAMLDGKWDHIMDQTHIGYHWWQQPKRQVTPALQFIMPRERAVSGDMALMVEGSNASVPGDDVYHANNGWSLELPETDPYGPESRWIEIFSVGTQNFDYEITADKPFARISKPRGNITPTPEGEVSDLRVYLAVDWDAVPEGEEGKIIFNVTSSRDYGLGNQYKMPAVYLKYKNHRVPEGFRGFVESDGHLSIETHHYTGVNGESEDGKHYRTINGYGKTAAGVELVPFDIESQTIDTAPVLLYDFYSFRSEDKANMTVRLGPSMNTIPGRPLQFAVAVDDAEPTVRQYIKDDPKGDLPAEGWYDAAADNGWDVTTTMEIGEGAHTLKLWALEPNLIFEKIIVDMGGLRHSYLGPPESKRVGVDD